MSVKKIASNIIYLTLSHIMKLAKNLFVFYFFQKSEFFRVLLCLTRKGSPLYQIKSVKYAILIYISLDEKSNFNINKYNSYRLLF